jgi:hypothetical protein
MAPLQLPICELSLSVLCVVLTVCCRHSSCIGELDVGARLFRLVDVCRARNTVTLCALGSNELAKVNTIQRIMDAYRRSVARRRDVSSADTVIVVAADSRAHADLIACDMMTPGWYYTPSRAYGGAMFTFT